MALKPKDRRPIAVLGLGRFGQRIAKNLARSGEEVIACDLNRDVVDQIANDVAQAVALNVTDEQALRACGAHQVKVGVVAIGEDFEAAVLATILLKQMDVPRIIARARSRTTAEVLQRVGAHEVVLAEDEAADRWGNRILGPKVFSQIEFHEGHSIVEFGVPKAWVGQSMIDIDVRKKFSLHIVAVKRSDESAPSGTRIAMIAPTDPLQEDDVLVIMGQDEDIQALTNV